MAKKALAIAAILVAGGVAAFLVQRPVDTAGYLQKFDASRYERAGASYFDARYSWKRLGKPQSKIDIMYDYDFAQLEDVQDALADVDRREALRGIFAAVTSGAVSETERHLKLLRFLHKSAFHNIWVQPMHPDRQAVFDPIVLLELAEMRCGAIARVAADLYDAAGYGTRIIQAAAHVSAEVFYDGAWHLIEADLYGGGQAPMKDGRVLSLAELSEEPFLIDALPTRHENMVSTAIDLPSRRNRSAVYHSYYFFSRRAYGETRPAFYVKTATPEQAANSRFYGWNYYDTVYDDERQLSDFAPLYEPGAPRFLSVEVRGDYAHIAWTPSQDRDGDLLGYRVYVSSKRRGWNYPTFTGASAARQYWAGGHWEPAMYDALYREPPSDVALITTSDTTVTVPLLPGNPIYLSVLPFDQHGESVGRRLYKTTEELVIRSDSDV